MTEKIVYGPDSFVQKTFLDCKSGLIIYGGGAEVHPAHV
jgi:hypothetical protein